MLKNGSSSVLRQRRMDNNTIVLICLRCLTSACKYHVTSIQWFSTGLFFQGHFEYQNCLFVERYFSENVLILLLTVQVQQYAKLQIIHRLFEYSLNWIVLFSLVFRCVNKIPFVFLFLVFEAYLAYLFIFLILIMVDNG